MATVKNTIILNDRMTPVLRSIIKSLNSTIDVLASTDRISDKAFENVKRDVQQATYAVDALEKEMQQLEKPIRETRKGFSGWQAAIVTANQGLQLIRSTMAGIGKVTNFADAQTMLTSRLTLMTGDVEAALALEKEIMASANRSRASYTATADSIAQMGMMASEAFSQDGQLNTKELVAFTESINKQLVMSGVAGTVGADAALYQLTQAMSSGVLRGDELRSIMEQAPVIADTIAKYMGVSKGEMREMASEGLITSEVVKNAMLSALDETNEEFSKIPVTFGQAMTLLKNKAIEESKPLVTQFSEFIQSDAFQSAFSWVMSSLSQVFAYIQRLINKFSELGNSPGVQQFMNDLNILVGVAAQLLELVVNVAVFVLDNWSLISPVVWGIVAALIAYHTITNAIKLVELAKNAIFLIGLAIQASKIGLTLAEAAACMTSAEATKYATAQQWALNAATYAFPGFWIILLIIAIITIIFLAVAAVNKATGSSVSAIGVIVGALFTAAAFIWNIIVGVVNFVLDAFAVLWNFIAAFVNFFANVFTDPIGAIARLFFDLVDGILSLLQSLAGAIDAIFGSNLAGGVQGWRNGLKGWVDETFGKGTEVMAKMDASSLHLQRWDYGDAYNQGYNVGASAESSINDFLGGFDLDELKNNAAQTAQNTGNLSDLGSGGNGGLTVQGEVSITDEDIKMLKDVAAAEWVNKYTTLQPQMTVTFGDVHETADAEKLLDTIETMMEEAYANALTGG